MPLCGSVHMPNGMLMPKSLFRSFGSRPSLPAILLCCLMIMLWIAGGASRSDVLGQALVRLSAAVMLAIALLWGPRPDLAGGRAVAILLGLTIVLVVLQLVPLPPSVWTALPGRSVFDALPRIGVAPSWRPLAMVPGAAANALFSLIVPLSVFLLLTMIPVRERTWLLDFYLALIAASALWALLQFSGGGFNNPLVNQTPGQVSGNFANRNHLALFLALGCLLAPVWTFAGRRLTTIRVVSGIGLLVLLILLILATGSRAGVALGLVAVVIALFQVRSQLLHMSRRLPRWGFPVIIIGLVVTIALAILFSLKADRAVGIDRLMDVDISDDMRRQALPTILSMVSQYFPVGTGFGSFDPMFRMHEPNDLLKLSYFNHAHNDYLEIALNAGLAGIVLLASAIGWWLVNSIRVWRRTSLSNSRLGRSGSAMLLLILVASAFDYPARTPLIMAMVVAAAMWMGWSLTDTRRSPLPDQKVDL